MKKLILILSWLLISWWVFAYNSQTPEELLQDYVFTNCWETEYGYAQKLTYENYKQIWNEICSNSNDEVSKKKLKEIFNFVEWIKEEVGWF